MKHARAPSQRQLRVGEVIRHELATLFARREVADADIDELGVCVSEVTASPDLKVATAYVRAFPGDDNERLAAALARQARRIRTLLAPRLKLKFTPEIRFRIDTAGDNARRIDELLRDPAVARDLGARRQSGES